MKPTNYDILEVSAKASKEVIDAAYQKLRFQLMGAAQNGDDDARNRLVILQEAYATLSSPTKRAAYDESLAPNKPMAGANPPITYAYESNSATMSRWSDSTAVKSVISLGVVAALYSAYKFVAQREAQAIQTKQMEVQAKQVELQSAVAVGPAKNDEYPAESERQPYQRPYGAAAREPDRKRIEIEYQDNIAAQRLEMERQRQQWAQERYEKDQARREAERVHQRNTQQLCNIYRSNGQYAQARQEGC